MSLTPLTLTEGSRRAMDRLAADLQRVLANRFVAVVAYDPIRTAAFATRLTADDLAALAPLCDRWHREGLATPLLLTPEEFRRSLDAFPLEYEAILDRHVLIAGTPPFGAGRPAHADLRRACEVQAQAFLIHLRQGWLHAADHHDEQEVLLAQSAAPLRALLVNLARLADVAASDDAGLARFAEQHLGLPARVVGDVLTLELRPEHAATLLAAPEFMPAYLATAEMLWAHVDTWHA